MSIDKLTISCNYCSNKTYVYKKFFLAVFFFITVAIFFISPDKVFATYNPVGYQIYDAGSCSVIYGFVCDRDSPNSQLQIDFWDTTTSTYLGPAWASYFWDATSSTVCGGTSPKNYGYSFTLPNSIKNYASHTIVAYGLSVNSSGVRDDLSNVPLIVSPVGSNVIVCAPPPVNGSCNATHYNCNAGSLGSTGDYPTQWQWWCNGLYGGTNVLCAENKPVNGSCSGTHYNCNAGTSANNGSNSTSWTWSCNGSYGGSTVWCSEIIPVNAACNPTHYNCNAGSLGTTADYPNVNNPTYYGWQWWCNGLYGGTNVLCTQDKPNCNATSSCGGCGSAPANTCSTNNGSQTCTYTTYSGGGGCKPTNFGQSCTVNNCSANYTCTAGTCIAPSCNATISCSGSCSAGANTCSTNNGTKNGCTYTTYSGGGSCITAAAPNQTCTLNNCSGGYACVSGSCIVVTTPPTGLSSSCPIPGTTGTMSWNAVSGATFYSVYAQTTDHVFNWAGACTAPNFCDHHLAPSTTTSFTTVLGQNYQWYVTAGNTAGESTVTGATFSCMTNNAQYISQSPPPSTMTTNQTVTVSVTMKNTGNTTWTSASLYSLGSQNPQDNGNWGTTRTALSSSVTPGSNYTFTFNITAPSTPGTYNFQRKMVQDGVQWFGDMSANYSVTVNPPPPPTPTGLSSSCPAPGTTAALSWGAASGATYYNLFSSTTGHAYDWGTCNPPNTCIASITGTSYNLSSRTAGTSYQWFVVSCNIAGCVNVATGPNFTCTLPNCNETISCSGSCSAPANTCSTNNGTKNGCTYTTYSGGGSCTQVAAPNQTCTLNNCSGGYACVSGSCILIPPPPTGLSSTCPIPGTTGTMSWNAVSEATFYSVYAQTTDLPFDWSGAVPCTAPNFCDHHLAPSTSTSFTTVPRKNYQWYVTAGNSAGESTVTGATFSCIADTNLPIGWETYGIAGYSDTCVNIKGWACDLDSKNTQLQVDLWEGGTYLGPVSANAYPDPNVNIACGNSTVDHGYSWTIPNSLKNGVNHIVTAYGLDVNSLGQAGSLGNPPLLGAPVTINCAIPSAAPTITNPTCIRGNTSDMYTISWGPSNPAVTYVDISTTSNFATYYNKSVAGSSTTAGGSTTANTGFGINGGYWDGTTWSASQLIFQPNTPYYVRTFNGSNSEYTQFTTPVLCNCDSGPFINCTGCTAAADTCVTNGGTSIGCQYSTYSGGGSCTPITASSQPSCTQACTIDKVCESGICRVALTPSQGKIYHITGNFTVNSNIALNAPGVVFVDGNLFINTNLTNTNSKTGIVFVVKGTIYIKSDVTTVNAFLIAHGKNSDGTDRIPFCSAWNSIAPPNGDDGSTTCIDNPAGSQHYLTINGSVISLSSSTTPQFATPKFARQLSTPDDPAETINYEPKYLIIMKDIFSRDLKIWREIQ